MNKTQEIFNLTCPYDNRFQGDAFRALFVCSAGLLRSATAANLFANKGWNTRCCGTHKYALIPLSSNLIHWAKKIYFMNEENLQVALQTFKNEEVLLDLLEKKSIILNVDDNYMYNQEELIKILELKVKEEYI